MRKAHFPYIRSQADIDARGYHQLHFFLSVQAFTMFEGVFLPLLYFTYPRRILMYSLAYTSAVCYYPITSPWSTWFSAILYQSSHNLHAFTSKRGGQRFRSSHYQVAIDLYFGYSQSIYSLVIDLVAPKPADNSYSWWPGLALNKPHVYTELLGEINRNTKKIFEPIVKRFELPCDSMILRDRPTSRSCRSKPISSHKAGLAG